jgi:hypothetical protein
MRSDRPETGGISLEVIQKFRSVTFTDDPSSLSLPACPVSCDRSTKINVTIQTPEVQLPYSTRAKLSAVSRGREAGIERKDERERGGEGGGTEDNRRCKIIMDDIER